MLSKIEIDILQHLWSEELVDQMNSRTIRRISEKIGINYFRVRTNLQHLLMLGYVNQGFRERSSNTFYINPQGVEIINGINIKNDK